VRNGGWIGHDIYRCDNCAHVATIAGDGKSAGIGGCSGCLPSCRRERTKRERKQDGAVGHDDRLLLLSVVVPGGLASRAKNPAKTKALVIARLDIYRREMPSFW
jgi:hypothetical protein